MFEAARQYISGKNSDKEMLDTIEAICSGLVKEMKNTKKSIKKFRAAINNLRALNKDLIEGLMKSDILSKKQEKIVNSSVYLTLKNLDTSREYQKHAYLKLSQIQDFSQINKILEDVTEYLNLSFQSTLKAIRSIQGMLKKQ